MQISPRLRLVSFSFFIILDSLLNNLRVLSYLMPSRQLQLAENSCADRQMTCLRGSRGLGICPWLEIYLKTGSHTSNVWFASGLTGLGRDWLGVPR